MCIYKQKGKIHMRLSVKDIEKSFAAKHVLKGVNFEAESGRALGLLGRNGAGKTTIIRIIMGVFPPDAGEISIDGMKVTQSGRTFGYLPEERGLYPKQIILNQIIYIGMLRGMNRHDAKQSALRWLGRVGMTEYADKKLNTLSKGNQQKIQLAATLVNDPDIIILDEPFSGLDPVNAQMLKDIVGELIDSGRIVLFSSHQMGYVEQFCDSIAMLNQGKIVLSCNLKEIKRGYDRSRVLVCADVPDIKERLSQLNLRDIAESVESEESGEAVIKLKDAADRDKLLRRLIDSGMNLDKYEILEPTLEEIFVEKAGEE